MQLLLERIVLLLARQTVLLLLLLDMLRFYVLPLRWRVLPISVPPLLIFLILNNDYNNAIILNYINK